MASLEETLQDLFIPVLQDLGCELWGIEIQRAGRFSTLRIFIDKPQGVTIDDCAEASRQMSAILDVEDPIKDKYHLEVSSPGMDRRLFTLEQMHQYIGQEISLNLRIPVLNRRKWQGKLQAIQNDMLTLEQNGEVQQLIFGNIHTARVVPSFK